MANATIVYLYKSGDYDNSSYIFRTVTPKGEMLCVEAFKDGIVTVKPRGGQTIYEFAETIEGCFDYESNFGDEVIKAFECDENATFIGIEFKFNGVTLVVTKENANKDKIYEEWNAGMEANAEKRRLEREAYMKTPEYRAKRAKELKVETRRQTVEQEVIHIDETTQMEFKDAEAAKLWEQFVEVNSEDAYSNGVVTYARRWAKYMQHLMQKHNKSVVEIADNASHVSDIEIITGYMYVCAVNILAQCWKYGEELQKWHNKNYGYEGDGIVNPVILTVNEG